MDGEARALERRVREGDRAAVMPWLRARQRAGERAQEPREGDLVWGDDLATALVTALGGRREAHALRDAGVPERRLGRLVGGFRALTRGQARPWSLVLAWSRVLDLDPSALALVAVVQPCARRREQAQAPRPLPVTYPARSCSRCRHQLWAVGIGLGVRCLSPHSPSGQGGPIPGLASLCEGFAPRAEQAGSG